MVSPTRIFVANVLEGQQIKQHVQKIVREKTMEMRSSMIVGCAMERIRTRAAMEFASRARVWTPVASVPPHLVRSPRARVWAPERLLESPRGAWWCWVVHLLASLSGKIGLAGDYAALLLSSPKNLYHRRIIKRRLIFNYMIYILLHNT